MKGKFTCIVSISYIDSEYLSCYGRMCMFFDRHNQKNSSEKEASGDITCTSCFGNNNRCGCDCGCPGQGATGPRGATGPMGPVAPRGPVAPCPGQPQSQPQRLLFPKQDVQVISPEASFSEEFF